MLHCGPIFNMIAATSDLLGPLNWVSLQVLLSYNTSRTEESMPQDSNLCQRVWSQRSLAVPTIGIIFWSCRGLLIGQSPSPAVSKAALLFS